MGNIEKRDPWVPMMTLSDRRLNTLTQNGSALYPFALSEPHLVSGFDCFIKIRRCSSFCRNGAHRYASISFKLIFFYAPCESCGIMSPSDFNISISLNMCLLFKRLFTICILRNGESDFIPMCMFVLYVYSIKQIIIIRRRNFLLKILIHFFGHCPVNLQFLFPHLLIIKFYTDIV